MVTLTEAEFVGMTGYNDQVRIRVSGDNPICGPNQRQELYRLVGDALGVVPRITAAYFTLAKTRRQFLQIKLSPDDFRARVVLGKCIINDPVDDSPRVQWERVRGLQPGDSRYNTLADLIYGYDLDESLSQWNFNAIGFNVYGSPKPSEAIACFLQWDYEYVFVPSWLPQYLKPYLGEDPNPYRRE